MQKQFVADASHELKTPLTVITANAELLQERYAGISAEADKWMEHVNQECREMRSLVESLLLLARNDSYVPGKGEFTRFSLSELVIDVYKRQGVYGEPGMDGGGCVVCPWNPFY